MSKESHYNAEKEEYFKKYPKEFVMADTINIIEPQHKLGIEKIFIHSSEYEKYERRGCINDQFIVYRKKGIRKRKQLLMGLKWYLIAVKLNIPVLGVEVDKNTTRNDIELGMCTTEFHIPKCDKVVNISDIKVPNFFIPPSLDKMQVYEDCFLRNGKNVPKPLSVAKIRRFGKDFYILKNKYHYFLLCKKYKIKYVPIVFYDKNK